MAHPSLRARPLQRAPRVLRQCAAMASQGQATGDGTRVDTLITFDVDGTLIEATAPDANQVTQHPVRDGSASGALGGRLK